MKFVSNALKVAFAAAVLMTAAGCGRVAPDAGEAGVLIRKPWFFGHGGVAADPITTGMSFIAMSTSVKYVSLNPQAFKIDYENMMSSNGIPLSFDGTLTLVVTDPVALVEHFGGGGSTNGTENTAWYDTNIQPILNTYVRDAFRKHDMQSLAIETSGTLAVEAEVQQRLTAYITQHHIPVIVKNFTVGRVNPPQDIKTQRIRTAEEQQRQQTELQTKIAEDNRKAAETARAEADNAYRQNLGLSAEQFVELQRIEMMKQSCSHQNCTFIVGNGTPVLNTGR